MPPVPVTQEWIDSVAEEFAKRCRSGERPTIQEYVDRYPHAAEQLREVLPSVQFLEQMKPKGGSSPNIALPRSAPGRLGEFRIVREVGRGGMGVVYEAVQDSLGRRVALKVLMGPALLDPKRLERFWVEAQAAARLHHPHIVPVYGLFENDGFHYYVMQFIDGRGLDRLIAEQRSGGRPQPETKVFRPSTRSTPMPPPVPAKPPTVPVTGRARGGPRLTPPIAPEEVKIETGVIRRSASPARWRQIAQIGLQVAEALQYAHAQGTLHRDIKPANLLLDHQGHMWITDFGLAKLAEHDGLTNSGDILGTLQYLAPECLYGQSGPQSDVYSLGLTLYELLTLEAPLAGASQAQLLHLIAEGEIPPPRKRNPAIPRDLETIVLKATARVPAHRYQMAQALADDLQRYLSDRPIEARRVSRSERAWRWCRRNPALATSAALSVFSLVAAAVVGWTAWAITTRALDSEARKRVEAQAATSRAEANVRLSLDALGEIFAALTPTDLRPRRPGPGHRGPPEPRGQGPEVHGDRPPDQRPPHDDPHAPDEVEAEQARALQAVLKFYEKFSQQSETSDPQLLQEAARANRRVGDIHRRLEETASATLDYRRAIKAFQALIENAGHDRTRDSDLANAYIALATLESPTVQTAERRQLLTAARQLADQLVAAHPLDVHQFGLPAQIDRERGLLEANQGAILAAEKLLRSSVELAEKSIGRGPIPPEMLGNLAMSCDELSRLLAESGRKADAAAALEKSITVLEHADRHFEEDLLLADQYDRLVELTDDAQRIAAAKARAEALRLEMSTRRPPRGPHGDDHGPHDRPPPGDEHRPGPPHGPFFGPGIGPGMGPGPDGRHPRGRPGEGPGDPNRPPEGPPPPGE